jgi:tRNA dimethylallyltransferase
MSTITAHKQSPVCIVVAGPTAVGKTAVAIKLAKHFNTSIISADSRQCFNELNIGVAKPTSAELEEVTHYFINSHSVHDVVTTATFEAYSLNAATTIFNNNPIAILVGGTGLYIKAFCEGLDAMPDVPEQTRKHIQQQYLEKGIVWLQQMIKDTDPSYYASGEIHNPQRLMRALEIQLTTGQSIRQLQRGTAQQRPFRIVKLALELPREELYQRINHRADVMIEDGLLEEVRSLLPFQNFNALQTVGYKELFDYLNGNCSLETAVTEIKKNTRHYAKRQLTWFKRDEGIKWFNPYEMGYIYNYTERKMQQP